MVSGVIECLSSVPLHTHVPWTEHIPRNLICKFLGQQFVCQLQFITVAAAEPGVHRAILYLYHSVSCSPITENKVGALNDKKTAARYFTGSRGQHGNLSEDWRQNRMNLLCHKPHPAPEGHFLDRWVNELVSFILAILYYARSRLGS